VFKLSQSRFTNIVIYSGVVLYSAVIIVHIINFISLYSSN
jgi:hypothetical protein